MPIVVGTDFSGAARPALLTAAALSARIDDGRLHLVHVVHGSLASDLGPLQYQELRTKLLGKLVSLAKEILPLFDAAKLHTEVLEGQAASSLCTFAEKLGAELLVVASQGHSESSLLRLGGVSERAAAAAKVPVLVVRHEAPFLAWLGGERRLRVLVGVDWTASSYPAIELVRTLRRAAPCDVIVGHVYYGTDAFSRYGLPGSHSWIVRDEKTEELLRRDLAVRVGNIEGEGSVSFEPTLGIGRAGGHLIDLAEAQRADLIVVGTHHRRGPLRLGSVSSVALHHSHSAVLCAPPRGLRKEEIPTIRRVLIATDLSLAADAAIPHGYALLAGRAGGEVHLLHVAEPLDGSRSAGLENPELLARLRGLEPDWARRQGIATVTEIVRRADVARAIRAVAARIGADVLCLASHGRSGLGRLVLGSIAEEVVRDETRPVLVVRQPQV